MTCPALDCSNRSHIPDVDLEANGDIAGPGVIIGFVGNAYFALLLLVLYYLVAFDPFSHPFGLSDADDEDATRQANWWRPSPVDTWLLDIVRRNTRRAVEALNLHVILLHDAKKLEPRFVSSVIHMCDLQLLTGFAILISAYIDVPCTMSAYHWQIVVYLAWFSSSTHLSGLVAARRYLYSRPWARFGRIAASILFLAMLLVAIVPTTYFNWDTADGQVGATEMSSSVSCLYDPMLGPAVWEQRGWEAWRECMDIVENRVNELHKQYPDLDEMIANGTASDQGIPYATQVMVQDPPGTCKTVEPLHFTSSSSFQAMIYSVTLLGWAFLSRFIRLWTPLNRFIVLRVGRPVTTRIQRLIRRLEGRPSKPSKDTSTDGNPRRGLSYLILNRPLLAWMIFTRLNMDCISSMFGELFWLSILIVWGTLRLIATVNFARDSGKVEGEQDWNFGQTLPVLLLVGPFLMVFRSFTTTRVKQDPKTAWQQQQQRQRQRKQSLSRQTTLLEDPFLGHEHTITRRTSSELRSQIRERDQYKSSTWLGACLISSFIHFSIVVGMSFGSVMELHKGLPGMSESIFRVWIYDYQLLVYLFVYYPLNSHISILAGLFHDEFCKKQGKRPKDDSSSSESGSDGDGSGGISPSCGHTKWMTILILFSTGLFPTLLWVCQLRSIHLPRIHGSVRVVVLGIALAGVLYLLGAATMLCCQRRRQKWTER